MRKGRFKDLTGQKFNKLTAIKLIGKDKNNAMVWLFECECGTLKEIVGTSVSTGGIKSCGCLLNECANKFVGQKFKSWTVISRSNKIAKDGRALWDCECECGRGVATFDAYMLRRDDKAKHCVFCHRDEMRKQSEERQILIKEERRIKNEEKLLLKEQQRINKEAEKIKLKQLKKEERLQNKNMLLGKKFDMLEVVEVIDCQTFKCKCDCGKEVIKTKQYLLRDHCNKKKSCGCYKDVKSHGMYNTRFYNIWKGVKKRCYQKGRKDYKNYGGRGIVMSESWKTFLNFYNDMYALYLKHCDEFGEYNTSIDRINVDGNYCKENCKWATFSEQAKNKRPRVGK